MSLVQGAVGDIGLSRPSAGSRADLSASKGRTVRSGVRGVEAGDIVTRVGDEPVTDSRTFYAALARWKAREREKRVPVRVLILDWKDPTRYRPKTRTMVVAGLREVYEACTIAAR
jgi:hypothetical protein